MARTPGFEATFLEPSTPSGLRVNFGTIGSAILWAPFYAIGDLTARMLHAFGRDVAVDGFSQPYIVAVTYASAFYGFLAIVLSAGVARRVTDYGLGPALIAWAGTPLLFYMYAAPPYSHACSAFAVALFVTLWIHVRRDWSARGLAGLGASAALMAMVREQDLFFVVGPMLDFALTANANRPAFSRMTKAAIVGTAVFAMCMLPQLIAYQALNGQPSPSKLVSRKMTWTAPHALQVLFSPEHGFFFWTPLAIAAIAGLAVLAARGLADKPDSRRIGICALAMVAVQVYVSGSVESWTVAGAFGQRRFVALTVLLVVGVATVWRVRGTGVRTGALRAGAGGCRGNLVERGNDGAVRCGTHGPSTAAAGTQRLRRLRDAAADRAADCLSLYPASGLVLPDASSRNRMTRERDGQR